MKDAVKDTVKKNDEQHGSALKRAYKSFVVTGLSKAEIDGYNDQVKLHIKTLIEGQLKEIQFTEVIMTQWVRWKKPVKSSNVLDTEDAEGADDLEGWRFMHQN